jgi:tetratricopeptide (TPR) repeat protein
MTGTGNIVGTADYMSPEQVKGAKVDGRSDLFSVGCMLYELVTGRRPFHSDNLMAIFYKITHEEANFDLVPQGAEYDALMPAMQKALAKNLEDRYQTAYDFAAALRDYLRDHASPAALGEGGLEGLLEGIGPATHAPAATLLEDERHPGGGATMEIGPTVIGQPDRPGSSRTRTPTLPPARGTGARGTAARGGTLAPTVVAPTPKAQPAARPMPRPLPPEPSGHPVLYAVLGALVVALLGAGGFIWYQRQQKAADQPPVTMAEAPPATAAAPPTTVVVAPPPTLAPPPTFAEASGSTKIAQSLRAAQAAFRDGNYDRAVERAQSVLAEDPSNAAAKQLVENALNGQRAEARFRSAQQALGAGDFERATRDAEEGNKFAPWDRRGTDLIGRIQQAQRDAAAAAARREAEQKQAAQQQQLNAYLGQADAALAAKNYDGAIGLYDEALKIDAQNNRAVMGRSAAIQARALAQAGPGPGPGAGGGGRGFVASRTSAQSQEQRQGSNVPAGFEDSKEVEVKKGSQAAELPGKIHFDVSPDNVRPGDKYTVKVFMQNEGDAPIQVQSMLVTTKTNGKGISGPVPPRTAAVAPGQRALLLETSDVWREDTSAWTMEVSVRTARGERYTNQVTWK